MVLCLKSFGEYGSSYLYQSLSATCQCLSQSLAAPASCRQRWPFRPDLLPPAGRARFILGESICQSIPTPPLRPCCWPAASRRWSCFRAATVPGAERCPYRQRPAARARSAGSRGCLAGLRPWDEFNGRIEAVESAAALARVELYRAHRLRRRPGGEEGAQLLFVIDQRPIVRPSGQRRGPARTCACRCRAGADAGPARAPAGGRACGLARGSRHAEPQHWPGPAQVRGRGRAGHPRGCSSTFTEVRAPITGPCQPPCSPWAIWPRPTRAC